METSYLPYPAAIQKFQKYRNQLSSGYVATYSRSKRRTGIVARSMQMNGVLTATSNQAANAEEQMSPERMSPKIPITELSSAVLSVLITKRLLNSLSHGGSTSVPAA